MSRDNELEEILASLKKRREETNFASDQTLGFKSQSRVERDAKPVAIDFDDAELNFEEPSLVEDEPLEDDNESLVFDSTEVADEPVVRDEEALHFELNVEPPVDDATQTEPEELQAEPENTSPADGAAELILPEQIEKSNRKSKRLKVAIGCIFATLIIVAGSFLGFYLLVNNESAYLKPYKEKYNVEFPAGILEEMCDAYGENQSVIAKLSIDDNELLVTSVENQDCAILSKGSTLDEQKQFTSIDVSGLVDIESMYSSANSFLSSSQSVALTSLYQKSNYRVVAAYYTNILADDDNGYVFPYNCYGDMTQDSFKEFVDRVSTRRVYDCDYKYSYANNYLILSADTDFMENFKFVIVCAGYDDEFEKAKSAVSNLTIHFPQVWYDKYGAQNTFIFASNWYPEIYTDSSHDSTVQTTQDDYK